MPNFAYHMNPSAARRPCPAARMVSFFCCASILLISGSLSSTQAQPTGSIPGDWQLVWSDDFHQANGSSVNPSKWTFETGGDGWGNNEMEFYTTRTNNVRIEDNKLVIEADKENFGGRHFTSGRILTRGHFAWTYGVFEARIKIPSGQGIWPAFWLLGNDISTNSWPNCGEVDIMENIGREPGAIHGTIHGPGYSGAHGIGMPVYLPNQERMADDFHVFAVDCEPGSISWFLDGKKYFTVTQSSLPKGAAWVFNQPKFILINLAVGGFWPGYPDQTSSYPQKMVVDYVKVYQKPLLAY